MPTSVTAPVGKVNRERDQSFRWRETGRVLRGTASVFASNWLNQGVAGRYRSFELRRVSMMIDGVPQSYPQHRAYDAQGMPIADPNLLSPE